MATLADVYTRQFANNFKGQVKPDGTIDEDDFTTSIFLTFLTTEPIEIGDKMLPSMVNFMGSFKWGTDKYPSKLREFIRGWWPTLTEEQLTSLDLEKLIGKAAYITVTHGKPNKQGKVYANVSAAMQPPAGSTGPMVPIDYKRHEEKEVAKHGAVDDAPLGYASGGSPKQDEPDPF